MKIISFVFIFFFLASCTFTNAVCGDGVVDLDIGESCDDGNTVDGDGCDAICKEEISVTCGNGTLENDEICDDGNTLPQDGCNEVCQSEFENEPNNDAANANPFVSTFFGEIDPETDVDIVSITTKAPFSFITVETLDDPNGVDLCNVQLDSFLTLLDTDGTTELAIDDDGGKGRCSRILFGNLPPGTYFARVSSFNKSSSFLYQMNLTVEEDNCGDGILAGTEECDDGNLQNNDGCQNNCTLEQDFFCNSATPFFGENFLNGNTSGLVDGFQGSCVQEGANEQVFLFDPGATTGILSILLTSNADFGIYARSDCLDASTELVCVDENGTNNAESLSILIENNTPVHFFVDGFRAKDEGAFTLEIEYELQ